FDPTDSRSVREAIAGWLNVAHFLYESHLTTELEGTATIEAQLLSEYENIILKRDASIVFLQSQVAEYHQKAEGLQVDLLEYQREAEKLQDEVVRYRQNAERLNGLLAQQRQ